MTTAVLSVNLKYQCLHSTVIADEGQIKDVYYQKCTIILVDHEFWKTDKLSKVPGNTFLYQCIFYKLCFAECYNSNLDETYAWFTMTFFTVFKKRKLRLRSARGCSLFHTIYKVNKYL